MGGALLVVVAVVVVWALSAGKGPSEALLGTYWRPSCASNWLWVRAEECRGQTSGPVPSIDVQDNRCA